jgi:hypothetical protein
MSAKEKGSTILTFGCKKVNQEADQNAKIHKNNMASKEWHEVTQL